MDGARLLLILLLVALFLGAAAGGAAARPGDDGSNGPPEHARGEKGGKTDRKDSTPGGGPGNAEPQGKANGHSRDEPPSDPPTAAPPQDTDQTATSPRDPPAEPDPSPARPHEETLPTERPLEPPVALFVIETMGPFVLVDAIDAFDPDGAIVTYHWDWGDGASQYGTDLEFHLYDDPFVPHTITLRITDSDGLQDTLAIPVAAAEDPLIAVMELHAVDDVLIADGYGSDAGSFLITSWLWEWGDGTTSEGPIAEHRYDEDGTYTVRLTVTDETDRSATTEGTAHVQTTMRPVAGQQAAAYVTAESGAAPSSEKLEVAPTPALPLVLALLGPMLVRARRR